MSTFVDDWVVASTVRLGASVEELARETIESIMGFQGKGGHKPPRPDIQKMFDAKELGDLSAKGIRADEWDEKYRLNDREARVVEMYQHLLRNGATRNDPQKAFEFIINSLVHSSELPNETGGFAGQEQEAKRFVGTALKKYEQQNWGTLYRVIDNALADAYRRGPLESYKLWPRMVQWIKDEYQHWLMFRNTPNRIADGPRAIAMEVNHILDVVTEGGKVLDTLRRENRLPQGFDVNRVSFAEFENWLMEWKRENRAAEDQGEVVYEFKDGWTIQKLTTEEQLQFEGDEMGHCVGSYAHQVGNGQTIIYSLRDPKGTPHVTMEIEALEGAPSYGFQGKEPPEDAIYNHEYIHPDSHAPGDHMEETVGRHDNLTSYHPTGETPFQVVQVQGNSNQTPKPEYQRKVKEFLDYLRSKGWKFERSPDWFAPFDDPASDDYDFAGGHGARQLDDWYDNHYKTHHEAYRGVNNFDPYGLPSERSSIGISDWKELFTDIIGSLTNDYDQGRWRGNWAELAQAVYHAWMIDIYKDRLSPEELKKHKDNLLEEIQTAEEQLTEWTDQYFWHTQENDPEEIVQHFQEIAEAKGVWDQIEEKVEAELGTTHPYGAYEREVLDIAQTDYEDLYYEAIDKIRDEIADSYTGNAFKFCQYLYMLAEKHGAVNPADLPDPNERHGGLPSFEELTEKPWPSQEQQEDPVEKGLPGAMSKTASPNVMYHISPPKNRPSILQHGLNWELSDPESLLPNNDDDTHPEGWPRGQYLFHDYNEANMGDEDDIWAVNVDGLNVQQDPYLGHGNEHAAYVAEPIPADRLTLVKAAPWDFEKNAWLPESDDWHLSSNEIQIYPIDHDRNVWFDEEGNQRERYRPAWERDPATGKMRQTGELQDMFLDKQGRQGEGWVAYHGDRPVGSLTYVADPAGWNMIGTTYVHPDYREQGLFNRMAEPLRASGKPIDAYVWNNPWLKQKVRGWNR